MLNLPKIGSVPKKGPKPKLKPDSNSKKITEKDLEETRARIRTAADDLEAQLNMEVAKVKNWPETVKTFPLEIVTGLFTTGFMIGSGILGEIKGSKTHQAYPAYKTKRRRSIPRILLGFIRGFIRPVAASAITAIAISYTKKK